MKTKSWLLWGLLTGVLAFIAASFRPTVYESETTFFVPLTLLERQTAQNGMGFGSPAEVDAHLELLSSPALELALEQHWGPGFELEVKKTRNGAVQLLVKHGNADTAAALANAAVAMADSLKSIMLRQNVEQSYDFTKKQVRALGQEVNHLRNELDSLRFLSVQDSLAYAARVFQSERQYGTAVVEWTQLGRQEQKLRHYLEAPAPRAYIVSTAEVPEHPAGLPALAWALVAVALYGAGRWTVEVWSKEWVL